MDLLAPLFVQVAMTFVLAIYMGYCRYNAVKAHEVKVRDIALRQPNWPEKATKVGNAFHNQIETPILFYLLVVLLILTKQGDTVQLYLAWCYIAARLVHLTLHITSNRVFYRFLAFVISIIILMIMWGRFMATQL